ncbi:MAG: [Fe-Fe] hydrogenase large subunit C-terminal domain-containing protein [Bacillota bacterium]
MDKTHSVFLIEDECEGCTNCVKNCPTKAIRVHQGRASIKDDYCIDCAACIRNCEYHAKEAVTTDLKEAVAGENNIALIPPSFYAQLPPDYNLNRIKKKLIRLGFAGAVNVSIGATIYSAWLNNALNNKESGEPLISSACPVVVRYIRLLYPELLDLVVKYDSPLEITVKTVSNQLNDRFSDQDFNFYFITPCPAKHTAVYYPPGKKSSYLSGAVAVDDIYNPLLKADIAEEKGEIQRFLDSFEEDFPFISALAWGRSGGEEENLNNERAGKIIKADGLERIKMILDDLANDNLSGIDYLEMTACPGGCLGGVLNIINPFQGIVNLEKAINQEKEKVVENKAEKLATALNSIESFEQPEIMPDQEKTGGFETVLARWQALETEKDILPGLDCAACGAPDCATLAEDIVDGYAERIDCIFMLRQEVEMLANRMSDLVGTLPPAMGRRKKEDTDGKK